MSRFAKVWWFALALKTALAVVLPLSNDEAYYWVWGHHPQLSYFDHPPMVGWLFTLGTLFESIGNAARLPGVWLGHLTLLVWHAILKPHLDDRSLSLWLSFVLLSPFLGVGSLIVTPDVPLLFFWSVSLLSLLKLVQENSAKWYVALGAALGAGFCSKYLIVIFVPVALIWLATTGGWRRIRWAWVPITIVTGLLFCAPVLYWNWKHEWASFVFQLNHGLNAPKRQWSWPLEYAGGQLAILFPIVAWFALRRPKNSSLSYLWYFGWLPLAFFFYTSFKARVEANWPIMAHPALLSLAFMNAGASRWLKRTTWIWALATVVVLSQVLVPWIPLDTKRLKTSEFKKYDSLALAVSDLKEVYMGSYQMAGAVSYRLRRQLYKLDGMNRRDFYDFTPQSRPKGDTFFVAVEQEHPLPAWLESEGYVVRGTKQITNELKIVEVARDAKDTDRK